MAEPNDAAPTAPLAMMIDFDGTLVEPNVAMVLVEKFCPNGAEVAEEVDLLLHAGKMTLREAWEREASLMVADQIPEMIKSKKTPEQMMKEMMEKYNKK